MQNGGEKMAISYETGDICVILISSFIDTHKLNTNKVLMKYHWHVHSTVAMIFSFDDKQLYSVGPEGVMVFINYNYSSQINR